MRTARPVPTSLLATMFLLSFAMILFELALTRLFAIVLFATWAHLALALAMLGLSAGALLQHLWPALVPDEGLERRLGWWSLAIGGSSVLATWLGVLLPVTRQFETPPEVYEERSAIAFDLLDPGWFLVLLVGLVVPFALAGLAFGGTFHRRKAQIGRLYAADLIGGALGAVVFVPLLYRVAGPDAVFVAAAATCLAAVGLFRTAGDRLGLGVATGSLIACAIAIAVAAQGTEVLSIRYSAGYAEANITRVRWTPLTRVAIHEDAKRGPYVVLDNASASKVVRTDAERAKIDDEPNRSLVYRLHEELRRAAAAQPGESPAQTRARIGPPRAHVAILAASAGPEVAIAQGYGFTGIEAIDIAPEIGDLVAEAFADAPANPYVQGDTRRVVLDGRAAILHADQPYDIIQMVHANLHSSAGLLSDAWSPALLETREAFALYLSRLSPAGILSFGRGTRTPEDVRAVVAALRDAGAPTPERHVALVTGRATFMLVRPRPWTDAERDALAQLVGGYRNQQLSFDPLHHSPDQLRRLLAGPVMTDDRPYAESPTSALIQLGAAARRFAGLAGDAPMAPAAIVYHALLLQMAFVALAGVALLAIPRLMRRSSGLEALVHARWALLYVACLGYGYLAVETVLIHHLVLFVGHPTYAITVVVLSMLLFSGLGAAWVDRRPERSLGPTLQVALAAVLTLGLAQIYVVAPALQAMAQGWPVAARVALVFAALAPLGFAMGTPFPLGLRRLRPDAASIVPWAWALNGYMSVVASLTTVLASRVFGYDAAFGMALAAYLLAFLVAPALPRVAPTHAPFLLRPRPFRFP